MGLPLVIGLANRRLYIASPEGAFYPSPGQRPGFAGTPYLRIEALKERTIGGNVAPSGLTTPRDQLGHPGRCLGLG
jgi:hypothetical protein